MNTEHEIIEVTDYKEEEIKETNIRSWIRKGFDYLRMNSICIKKEEQEIITMKLVYFVLLLMVAGEIVLPLMIVGLFFKFNYSLVGRNNGEEFNKFMDNASHAAQAASQSFKSILEQK